VLNFNGKHFLSRCLSSIKQLNYPSELIEVILVDNSSTDDSLAFVEAIFPWVKRIKLNHNYGFCGGNNRGIKYANGDYIAFLNNDTVVDADWLIRLVNASIKNSVQICASKTLFMKKPEFLEFGGGKFTLNGRGFSIGMGIKDKLGSLPFYTGYPCAAAMLIRKDVFLDLGGFDEDFFACLDDTDLGWRAWLYGYAVLYCPDSCVYHAAGGTTGKGRITTLKTFQGTKNSVMNILKNVEFKNILPALFISLSFDVFELFLLIKQKNLKCVAVKVRAYLWLIKNQHLTWQKRSLIQKKRVVSDCWLVRNGLMALPFEALNEYRRLCKINLADL
jgi:GT2 family glycosyltransferase